MLSRLFGAVSGGLHRSLSTAASRPPWALIYKTSVDKSGAPSPGASFHVNEPPFVTNLTVPAHFVHPRPLPDRETGEYGFVSGKTGATSSDGFLLVCFWEARFNTPTIGDGSGSSSSAIRDLSWFGMNIRPELTRFVCNPLSGELYRLPDVDGTKRTSKHHHLGLLTQSEGGHGPPDRYAVAEMFSADSCEDDGFVMRRFLSETGEWDKVVGLPSPLPPGRWMHIENAVVPFGDRLWWIDESWGAISADPLSDRPELRFVELPRGSVLPDLDGVVFPRTLGKYRRVGVSEGKMRYVEVSKENPFVISSFSLDDGASSWTLDHEVAFAPIWADEHASVLEKMPAIGAIDPLNSNVVYLICGGQLLGLDMVKEKVTGSSRLAIPQVQLPLLPCVLPTWLESSQIPSAGRSEKTTGKREALPDTDKMGTFHLEIELLK
ncbi:uncharacterized protein LOC100827565 [Brachypodium distachyon]|uniref:DUF1618 domain-containing protein n=1 Tax=Brachypodium distachyon TaxID=15368 RepID=I1HIJ9_BRADI|nr:uncharacterized protein LOC100827565 [Brachypodium distachyon]KQK05819.1 hypothetical protein BRADI_2g22710v3 [Brachypodium distachyon]|eukprot:XP_003566163.1 uncharacterized protein LOC100827565 [Brachypodium distachyon]